MNEQAKERKRIRRLVEAARAVLRSRPATRFHDRQLCELSAALADFEEEESRG